MRLNVVGYAALQSVLSRLVQPYYTLLQHGNTKI